MTKNIINTILILTAVILVCMIFANSLSDIPTSKAQSLQVKEILEPFLELFVGKGNVTDHLVRKLAHFAEFGLIGFVVALLFRRVSALPMFCIMTIGLCDETIQIFSGRGDMVSDVWLDFFGGMTGFMLGILLIYVIKKLRAKQIKK